MAVVVVLLLLLLYLLLQEKTAMMSRCRTTTSRRAGYILTRVPFGCVLRQHLNEHWLWQTWAAQWSTDYTDLADFVNLQHSQDVPMLWTTGPLNLQDNRAGLDGIAARAEILH
jgi:hypothetical protein